MTSAHVSQAPPKPKLELHVVAVVACVLLSHRVTTPKWPAARLLGILMLLPWPTPAAGSVFRKMHRVGSTVADRMVVVWASVICTAPVDPTLCILQHTDPAAGVGQGSIIKISI